MTLRKHICVILSVLIAFAAFGVIAYAAEAPAFELMDASGEANDSVDVELYINNNAGITALQVQVAYSADDLELVGVSNGGLFSDSLSTGSLEDNPVTISWYSSDLSDVADSGRFAVLSFNIKENAKDSEVTLTYDEENVFNKSFENVKFDVKNAKVTVTQPTTAATETTVSTEPGETTKPAEPGETTKPTEPGETSAPTVPDDTTVTTPTESAATDPATAATATADTTAATQEATAAPTAKATEAAVKSLKNGASKTQVEKFVTGLKNDKDPAGSTFAALSARQKAAKKDSVKIGWNKVKNAKSYVVYGAKCGSKYKKLSTASKTSYTQKKLKKNTYYKYLVIAFDKNGKSLATSKTLHIATTGGKNGNVKSVTAKPKSLKLKVKKSKKLSITLKAASKKAKVKNHRKTAFESSNTKVATVNAKGKVTAKKKGTAYIYAYAQNGIFKKIKVTVK